MSVKLKVGLAISIFFMGMQTAAASNKAEDRAVNDIIVNAEGRVTVKLDGDSVNPAGCPNTAYVIEANVASKKEWLAMLLTAKASGETVTLVIAPNSGDCANGGKNPRIVNLQT